MPARAAASCLNHVLSRNEWARERLRKFAGKRVEFRSAPLPVLRLAITESGLIEPINLADVAPCDLVVTLSPTEMTRLLARDEPTIASLDCAGPVDLAEAVQDLLRRLDWEFEEDLSRIFGDMLAHRMAGAGRDLISWQKGAALRLAQNFAEYWTEESPLLARSTEAAAFARDVEATRESCERLEDRIARLEATLTETKT
jgi:ubiquinone biosynthesis protein UbiJ